MLSSKIYPCLWYVHEAEEAARLYTSLLPDSSIDTVARSPSDYPGGKEGDVLTVEFTLAGQRFLGLNGGSPAQYTHALSLVIECEDQAEVDKVWDGLLSGGGSPQQCGWLSDRWGVNWQVTPRIMNEIMAGPDKAKAKRVFDAMMTMVKIDVAAIEAAAKAG